MFTAGVLWSPARQGACTIARHVDGNLTIRSHGEADATPSQIDWFRQTAECGQDAAQARIEGGESSVTRRVAVGLNVSSSTLLVGLGEATTSGALRASMRHIGAAQLTELDGVAESLVTVGSNGQMAPLADVGGGGGRAGELVTSAVANDFFYLAWKGQAGAR